MSSLDDDFAELEALKKEIEGYDAPTSSALMPAGSDAPTIKKQLASRRNSITQLKSEVEKKEAALKRRIENQMAELRGIVEPLRKQIALLEEGIWTINLYLGRDQEIIVLRDDDHEPAPVETPISVRQLVLNMDEEARVSLHTDGIDASNLDEFDKWLLDHPDNLEQVLPERRGVVVLRPRGNNKKDYGEPWLQAQMEEANNRSYWLIRNGDRLYRMGCSLECGTNLIPLEDEFTSFFEKDRFGHSIKPGTREWQKAEEQAGARQRHYMRVALVMQGLIDLTTVFHPLPGAEISFLQPESYDAGHVVVITDAEKAIGTGLEPFRSWQKRLNQELRPGMRIIGDFGGYGSGFSAVNEAYEKVRFYRHSRLSPENAEFPRTGHIYVIEDRKGDDLIIRYERSEKRHGYEFVENGHEWGRWGEWPYKTRASCKLRRSDRFILPFDLIDVETMEKYLGSRADRSDYLDLVPVIQAAIEGKREEFEAEEPFRAMLAGVIATRTNTEVSEAQEAVPSLVQWWKIGNKWFKPLVNPDSDTEQKAIDAIVSEYESRRVMESEADADLDSRAVEVARSQGRTDPGKAGELLHVARRKDGTVVAYYAEDNKRTFCEVVEFTKSTMAERSRRRWKLPQNHWRRWRTLHTTERWEGWNFGASLSNSITEPEIQQMVRDVVDLYREVGDKDYYILAATYDPKAWNKQEGCVELYLFSRTKRPPKKHLTAGYDYPRVHTCHGGWRRGAKGDVVVDVDRRPWHATHWQRDGKPPWMGGREILYFVDDEAIARAGKTVDKWNEWDKERVRKRDIVNDACDQLESRWNAEQMERARQRFVDDYNDPALWEGHRKTLRLKRMPWTPSYHGDDSALQYAMMKIVDRGDELSGLSVRQIAETAGDLKNKYGFDREIPEKCLEAIGDWVIGDPKVETIESEDDYQWEDGDDDE